MARTIQSPGVEINEIDLSLRPSLPICTNILVPGFSNQGPTDEVIQVSSISEFEQLYGLPTNAAERYFYHTVKSCFNGPGNIFVSRLPYGPKEGDTVGDEYTALVYPVYTKPSVDAIEQWYTSDVPSLSATADKIITGLGANWKERLYAGDTDADDTFDYVKDLFDNHRFVSYSDSDTYLIGEPEHVKLTQDEYDVLTNNELQWNQSPGDVAASGIAGLANSGIIVLNNSRRAINQKFEGHYIGLSDNTNLNPATDFDSLKNLRSINKNTPTGGTVRVPSDRLTFNIQGSSEDSTVSVSEVIENLGDFDMNSDEYSDVLTLGMFKVRQSTLNADTAKLDYVLSESYIGSLDFHREKFGQTGGAPQSFFLESVTEDSANIRVFSNPYLSKLNGSWADDNAIPEKRVRILSDKHLAYTKDKFDPTNITTLASAPDPAFLNRKEEHELGLWIANLSTILGTKPGNNLYPHGVFKPADAESKHIGAIPTKLEYIFETIDNHELYPLDITLDGGLSTIFVGSHGGRRAFDDEAYFEVGDGLGDAENGYVADEPGYDDFKEPTNPDGQWGYDNLYTPRILENKKRTIANYNNVANVFVNFAANKRKDHMTIIDPLRYIFVQGQNNKTLGNKKHIFSKHVYWPLRHNFESQNSSYAATYGNWARAFDGTLGRNIYLPFSGRLAAIYSRTDANFQPWYAPAGFTRGTINTVSDIAVYPKQKHRDQMYKINVNPIANFPNDGFVVFGQKTLQAKPSAFDRINVRRLFLYLEKAVRATVKYYVFEPNTLFTRTQVVNVLTPIFEKVKNTEGMYDYLIVCDERNNTPFVIDQNELVIDIYIKPVRAAEFILCNFYATRTDQNFSELVS